MIADSSGWDIHKKLENVFKGNGGSASPAGIKIQFIFDFISSSFALFDITQGNVPDQEFTKTIPRSLIKRDLILFDLGYFCLSVMHQISQKGAFYLSRYLHGTGVFVEDRNGFNQLNIVALLQKNRQNDVVELNAYLGASHHTSCRLIAVKLPTKQRNIKLRKARRKAKKNGRSLTKKQIILNSWNIYVTNVPSEMFSAYEVSLIYRIRWTIELLFKQFKSTMRLHIWNHGNEFRLQSEIIGTLIVAAIIMSMHGLSQVLYSKKTLCEISLEKLFKLCKNNAYRFFELVSHSLAQLRRFLKTLLENIPDHCFKDSRTSRPTSLQALCRHHKIRAIINLPTHKSKN